MPCAEIDPPAPSGVQCELRTFNYSAIGHTQGNSRVAGTSASLQPLVTRPSGKAYP